MFKTGCLQQCVLMSTIQFNMSINKVHNIIHIGIVKLKFL